MAGLYHSINSPLETYHFGMDPSSSAAVGAPSQGNRTQVRFGQSRFAENLPGSYYYRDKVFIVACIDLGLCAFQGILIIIVSILLLILTNARPTKEVPPFSKMSESEERAIFFALIFIISLYLAHFILKIISAVSLLQATQEGVSPQAAKEKAIFWSWIKMITLVHAILSLLGGIGVTALIINILNVAYCIASLIVVQLFIRELDQRA